jgi:hypothetical protein
MVVPEDCRDHPIFKESGKVGGRAQSARTPVAHFIKQRPGHKKAQIQDKKPYQIGPVRRALLPLSRIKISALGRKLE